MLSFLLTAAIVVPSVYAGVLVERNVTVQEDCDHNSSFIAAAWYAGYHSSKGFPVSKINWELFTHMNYAFATTTPDIHSLGLKPEDESIIPEFVAAAKSHGVEPLISLGGWTGSQYFSTAVATEGNRTTFVETLSDFVSEYGFSGIDFDWEYPNHQGIGCNTISTDDTSNFLLLLQALRKYPSTANLTLSAAVTITPFVGSNGNASTNVEAFAEVLDYIEIMNYDIWGSWSTGLGPNAPLDDSCAAPENRQGSATSAVKAWTNAGFPTDKIVLAVPGYGRSLSVNTSIAIVNGSLAPYPAFNPGQPKGDAWDIPGDVVCGIQQPIGGIYNFWGLIEAGFLTVDGQPAPGIYSRYDNCSQTPYVYNKTSQIGVSYDDPRSFAAKGEFIASKKLRGYSLFEAGGDPNGVLSAAIRGAAWHS